MNHPHTATAGAHTHRVLPVKLYLGVGAALLMLTVLTVAASYVDFGVLNIVIAIGIAAAKASLVALFFMGLKYDERFNSIVLVSAFLFLSLFFIFTLADTRHRGEVVPLERGIIAAPDLHPGGADHGAPAGADSTAEGKGKVSPAEGDSGTAKKKWGWGSGSNADSTAGGKGKVSSTEGDSGTAKKKWGWGSGSKADSSGH